MPKLSPTECKYETKDDMGELEGLSERLQSDLRRNIRVIGNFPILSDNWCGMAETLTSEYLFAIAFPPFVRY